MSFLFDPRQRQHMADGIFSWVDDHLEYFDPPQEDEILDDTPEDVTSDKRRKAFGELGACLRLINRCPDLRDREDVQALCQWWIETGDARQIFFDLRRRIQLFPLRVVAQAVRATLGGYDQAVTDEMQNVMERGVIDRYEISAWHKMDMKYYVDLIGLCHGYDTDENLFKHSFLQAMPTLQDATNYDLYGLTHLIFGFADFGNKDITKLVGPHMTYLLDYTAGALAMCLARCDWDLAVELMMTRIYLGVRNHTLDREAARAICECQKPSGFIPGRKFLAGTTQADDPMIQREKEFFDVYHPTLVTMFLITAELSEYPA